MSILAHGSRRLLFLSLIGLAVTPRASLGAWPHDPSVNVPLAPVASSQYPNDIISDGAGGAIVAWADTRGSSFDIYAQRIVASGAVAPGWPATGLLVCNAANSQGNPVMVSDGAGGAIIAWADPRGGLANRDIYAMRVNADGTLGAGWPVNGRLLSSVNVLKDEQNPVIASDGAGGAIVAWELVFTSPTDIDIYAARVTSAGALGWSTPLVTPGAKQDAPCIVADGAGGAIIGYEDNSLGTYDLKAVGANGGGGINWGPTTICASAFDQRFPQGVSDGAGGAILAWTDTRSGDEDVFASRVTSTGAIAPGWTSVGNAVASLGGGQLAAVLASDGNHGALIAWSDGRFGTFDVFAQRMLGGGTPAPGWPINGVEVTPGGTANPPAITSDGAGGAIVSWPDSRYGANWDVYASRVISTGALGPGWTYGGTPISVAAGAQIAPLMIGDGAGGAIIVWTDNRSVSNDQGYAQRVDLFGQLGNAEPAIASVLDIKGDQGGHVRLAWNSSYLDADPLYAVGAYWIWRQTPISAAMAAVANGGAWLDPQLETLAARAAPHEWSAVTDRRLFTSTVVNGTTYAWEYLASQPASGFSQYSYVAATTRDSLGGSNPYTLFMVQARAPSGPAFWSSAPDSGYSVDNLPPLAPSPFTGYFTGGATALHWGPSLETDFGVYRLYRGSSAGFVPGPSNFVVEKPDTGYSDAAGTPFYYKLSAVDVHGNESAFALLTPSGTLDAPAPQVPSALWLGQAAPNPALGAATFHFALPREGTVSLRIYDAAGRLVRELARGVIPAGDHSARWDGRDAAGRELPSGVYLVELAAQGRALHSRFVRIR